MTDQDELHLFPTVCIGLDGAIIYRDVPTVTVYPVYDAVRCVQLGQIGGRVVFAALSGEQWAAVHAECERANAVLVGAYHQTDGLSADRVLPKGTP